MAKNWQDEAVVHAGDNVDVRSRCRHESSKNSTMDLHFYNSILFRSRVNFSAVSDIPPAVPEHFTTDHYCSILPSSSDNDILLSHLNSIVAEAWSSIDDDYKKYVTTPHHPFSDEMSTKTSMVSLNYE